MVTKQKKSLDEQLVPKSARNTVVGAEEPILGLTREHIAFLKSLKYVSAPRQAQAVKTPADVGEAFSPSTLSTIKSSSALGGSERIAAITGLLEQHARLVELTRVLEPMARLVNQNLMVVGSDLSTHVSEVVKTARAISRTRPELLEGIKDANDWVAKHHPGRPTKKAEPEATKP